MRYLVSANLCVSSHICFFVCFLKSCISVEFMSVLNMYEIIQLAVQLNKYSLEQGCIQFATTSVSPHFESIFVRFFIFFGGFFLKFYLLVVGCRLLNKTS